VSLGVLPDQSLLAYFLVLPVLRLQRDSTTASNVHTEVREFPPRLYRSSLFRYVTPFYWSPVSLIFKLIGRFRMSAVHLSYLLLHRRKPISTAPDINGWFVLRYLYHLSTIYSSEMISKVFLRVLAFFGLHLGRTHPQLEDPAVRYTNEEIDGNQTAVAAFCKSATCYNNP
jgi:hypothetical protein